jgi:hypothetical protein
MGAVTSMFLKITGRIFDAWCPKRHLTNITPLCWRGPAAIYLTDRTILRVVREKNMDMSLVGPQKKNDCAGEVQQQFI